MLARLKIVSTLVGFSLVRLAAGQSGPATNAAMTSADYGQAAHALDVQRKLTESACRQTWLDPTCEVEVNYLRSRSQAAGKLYNALSPTEKAKAQKRRDKT